MLTFQLPQMVKKGSIHDSSQNIRELTLCQYFFVMSDWIPLFIQLQSVWWKNVKEKSKKKGEKRVILFWEAAFGKENVNRGKNRATNDILLKSAKKLYVKCRSWWGIPLNPIKITQRLIYTNITLIVSWWSVTQLSKWYIPYAIYIFLL